MPEAGRGRELEDPAALTLVCPCRCRPIEGQRAAPHLVYVAAPVADDAAYVSCPASVLIVVLLPGRWAPPGVGAVHVFNAPSTPWCRCRTAQRFAPMVMPP